MIITEVLPKKQGVQAPHRHPQPRGPEVERQAPRINWLWRPVGLPFRKAGRRLWEMVGPGLTHQKPQNIVLHPSVLALGPGAPGPCNQKLCMQIHPSGGRHQPQDAVCPIPHTSGHQYHHSVPACHVRIQPTYKKVSANPKGHPASPTSRPIPALAHLGPSSNCPRIWPHTLVSWHQLHQDSQDPVARGPMSCLYLPASQHQP